MRFLIFLLPVIALFSSCEEKKAKTIYLIPENFRGDIIITYDIQNGQDANFEKRMRVIRVPASGIVSTQHVSSTGVSEDKFYMVSADGKRTEITFDLNTTSDKQVCIHNMVTSSKKIDGAPHHIEAFMVHRKDSIQFYKEPDYNF